LKQVQAASNVGLRAPELDLAELLHAMGHDMPAPMRQVRGFLSLLQSSAKDRLGPNDQAHLQHALEGVDRLAGMVNAVRRLALLDRHAQPAAEVPLNDLVDAFITQNRAHLQSIKARIGRDDLPPLVGPPEALQDLMHELLQNAVNFRSPRRPLRVSVRVEDTKSHWVIVVEDNGRGIAVNDQARCFRLFQRFHPDVHPRGVGAGLALCRRIAHRNGGRLFLSSEPEKSTAIRLEWPKTTGENNGSNKRSK
jgi:light-regulated signal transduction histidine kinase (bacteriophytochrome)